MRGVLELQLDEGEGVEVVSPHGRSYIWTRKHAPVHVSGRVTVAGHAFDIDGDDGFLDESAGYHARHTAWRWSAGVGRTDDGRRVAWNLVDGVHDAPSSSERTVWVDGEAARGAAPGVRRRPQRRRRAPASGSGPRASRT